MRHLRLLPLGLLALAAPALVVLVLLAGGTDASPGTTERVSVASDGSQVNGDSWVPAIGTVGRAWVEKRIGDAAAAATAVQILRSDCPTEI